MSDSVPSPIVNGLDGTSGDHDQSASTASPGEGSIPFSEEERNNIRKRVRARQNWFQVSNRLRRDYRIETMKSHMSGIPRDTTRKLCNICASLELNEKKFMVQDDAALLAQESIGQQASQGGVQQVGKFEFGSGRGRFALGSLACIRSKADKCPFCNLVLRSVQELSNDELVAHEKLDETICYASWQLDGREIRDLHRPARPLTRRIRLDWEYDRFPQAYIMLLSDSDWGLFMGRDVKSSKTNVMLIRNWIDLCVRHHGSQCDSDTKSRLDFENIRTKPYFGVIDVREMRLRELPPGSEFVALSYTWGEGEKFSAVRENVDKLRDVGGIKKFAGLIPKAITDTINLVRNLGEHFLWIDALCIVQNSRNSLKLNSMIMDKVYGNARFTVCAADDPDATAGLVGLDPTRRRFSQHTEPYSKGVNLMVSHVSETYIKRSRWNRRAWTFQERLLSRRCLIFTQGRIYFQCRSTALSEDVIAENEAAGWSIELLHAPLQMLTDLDSRALRTYNQCVELYSGRELTKIEDILSAFNGITNLIAKSLNANFIWGLPNSHFDWALLWEPQQYLQPRKTSGQSENNNDSIVFPSWSWCGWIGKTHYNSSSMTGALSNLREWLTHHTWIIWYIRNGHGELRLIRSGDNFRVGSIKQQSRWQGYDQGSSDPSSGVDQYGRPPREDCGRSDQFFSTLPEFPHNISIATGDTPDPDFPDMQYLQFWTWSAFFRLSQDSDVPTRPGTLKRYSVTDCRGDWCGTIVLDKRWERNPNATTSYEFSAISEAREFSREEYDNWNYYIPKDREESEWDLYHVLLIEKDAGNIAYRVGKGKVYKEAFESSFPKGKDWREFILG